MIFPSFLLPFVLWTFCAFCASAALTALVRHFLVAKAVLDIPNARSMHKAPVPRGGGLAILMTLVPALGLMLLPEGFFSRTALLLPALFLLFGISWLDDRQSKGGGLGPGVRLLAHLSAAFLGQLALPPEALLFGGFLPFGVERALIVLGWAWFMNLYNFMDGIDGIAGTETICLAFGGALVLLSQRIDDPFCLALAAVLTGAAGGFLLYNWAPAKIFLGDVGSIPLGFLTGFLLLKIALAGFLIPALILPLYYLADSGITIVRRALRGEKIWQPHRQHFYQKAAARLGCHSLVVWRILAANLLLIGAALCGAYEPAAAFIAALAIVAGLLATMHKGKPVAPRESPVDSSSLRDLS